ncbi:lysyl-tRNA synthetase [Micavibrio aeruginosavorus ARL-13]|uniref:Lysine--tRNA ligase n=2 Tax=Micavibrio aeruginosavorus TaxID=349221 RepID=G2KPC0_MICAA|nr:lysyl-tRNA synthetase [Micavibrio aeruginosavorus ARL-13]
MGCNRGFGGQKGHHLRGYPGVEKGDRACIFVSHKRQNQDLKQLYHGDLKMGQNPAQNSETTVTTAGNPRLAKQVKLDALKAAGIDPYPHVFPRTHQNGTLQDMYKDLPNGTETDDHVAVAGRIMAIRNNGMFLDLMDPSGKMQVFCHKDSMSEEALSILDYFDIGDIIGAEGTVRRTPRGELSVRAKKVTMLTKSLMPLPEKYHGLTDVEQRYRQRYLDLIMNDESRQKLLMRSKIISTIRKFMEEHGAIEVETPMMHPILGGASAKPFVTHHNALDADFFLRIAPELYLKRLIVGGLADAVFEINRNFRNEGISYKHNPEFTMIESYHAYKDYYDVMDLIEKLVQAVAMAVHGTLEINFQGNVINLGSPWARKGMVELVQEETGVDFMSMDAAQAHAEAKKLGVHVDPKANWGQVVETIFGEKVEHKLIQPIHVIDHPLDISPLSKVHRNNPRLVERFESYINGWEMANAFTELNDPKIQHDRFMDQVAQREGGNEEAMMVDHDFVTALEYGLPPTGGWGMGIDRLTMIMTDSHNIREVIAFPTLKPEK